MKGTLSRGLPLPFLLSHTFRVALTACVPYILLIVTG